MDSIEFLVRPDLRTQRLCTKHNCLFPQLAGGLCWERFQEFFGIPAPQTAYTVRYWLDHDGPYICWKYVGGGAEWILLGHVGNGQKDLDVCQLPLAWDGKRVSREVIA